MTAKRRGKGPTPKAEDRHWNERRKKAQAAKSAKRTGTSTQGPGTRSVSGQSGAQTDRGAPGIIRRSPDAPELVTGRNPLLEALRAGVPGTTLYVMPGGDAPVREAIQLSADRGIPLIE